MCSNGAEPMAPNKGFIGPNGEKVLCSNLFNFIDLILDCDNYDGGMYGELNLQAYCECPGAELPSVCTDGLCTDDEGETSLSDPDEVVLDLTCEEWNDYALALEANCFALGEQRDACYA